MSEDEVLGDNAPMRTLNNIRILRFHEVCCIRMTTCSHRGGVPALSYLVVTSTNSEKHRKGLYITEQRASGYALNDFIILSNSASTSSSNRIVYSLMLLSLQYCSLIASVSSLWRRPKSVVLSSE